MQHTLKQNKRKITKEKPPLPNAVAHRRSLKFGEVLFSQKHIPEFGGGRLTGVPKPVTASQPAWAGKPVVLQPDADPLVISVNAAEPVE